MNAIHFIAANMDRVKSFAHRGHVNTDGASSPERAAWPTSLELDTNPLLARAVLARVQAGNVVRRAV